MAELAQVKHQECVYIFKSSLLVQMTFVLLERCNTRCQADDLQFWRQDLRCYTTGTVCRPISDYVVCHMASSGGY